MKLNLRLTATGTTPASGLGEELRRPKVDFARPLRGGNRVVRRCRISQSGAAAGHFRDLRRARRGCRLKLLGFDQRARSIRRRDRSSRAQGRRGGRIARRLTLRRFRPPRGARSDRTGSWPQAATCSGSATADCRLHPIPRLIAKRAGWASELLAATAFGAALPSTAAAELAIGFAALTRRCIAPVFGNGCTCIVADCWARVTLLHHETLDEELEASTAALLGLFCREAACRAMAVSVGAALTVAWRESATATSANATRVSDLAEMSFTARCGVADGELAPVGVASVLRLASCTR